MLWEQCYPHDWKFFGMAMILLVRSDRLQSNSEKPWLFDIVYNVNSSRDFHNSEVVPMIR